MRFIDDLDRELKRLISAYENYIFKNENAKLEFIIDRFSNKLILLNDGEIVDEFIIRYNKCENKKYKYISLKLIDILLGNNIIHVKDNILYNDKHKPYLKIIINDEYLLNLMRELLVNQDESLSIKIKNINKDVLIFYQGEFMSLLDMRVSLSERILRKKW